jgi:putative hydrolase of the HAD superfamily
VAVDAVIFDWGGTLTPWHSIEPIGQWIDAVGDPELAQRLLAAETELWARARDHQISATLDDVFAAAGVAPTDPMRRAVHDWWEPHTYLDPDAPALFEALRERGIKIGVLSNTLWPRTEHERIFERDGVLALIDGSVYTSELPWTKPHPEAFRAALAAVEVDDPARAIFVGDRPYDDVHGAQSAGLRAVLIPHSDIPAAQQGPVVGRPDAVVQRLGDVLAVVDAWNESRR